MFLITTKRSLIWCHCVKRSYIFVHSALCYTWQLSVTLQWLNRSCFFLLYLTVSRCHISEGEKDRGGKRSCDLPKTLFFPFFPQVLCKTLLKYTVHPGSRGSRGTGNWRGWIDFLVFVRALHFQPLLQYRANVVLPLHQASVPSDYQVQTSHPVLPSELKRAGKIRWLI